MGKTKNVIILSALLLLVGCVESKSSKSKGEGSNLTLQTYDFKSCPDLTGNYRCNLNGTNGGVTFENEPANLNIKQYKTSENTPILDIEWDGARRVLISDGKIYTSTRDDKTFEFSINCSETTDEIFLHMVHPDQLWTKQTFRYFGRYHVEVDSQGVNESGSFDISMDCY